MLTNVLLVIIAVLLFGIIVFVHEFGHFFTAKLSGIKVNEFAIGMGPTLFHFGKKETRYSLRLFPVGGFCAMEGEDSDSEDEGAFNKKSVWKRIIVVVAGGIMNILLGIVLMGILLGQQTAFNSTTVAQFTENSALEAAGILPGDQFYSVNGYRVFVDRDLSFALSTADPNSVDLVMSRDGQKVEFHDVKFNTRDSNGTQVLVLDFYVQAIPKNIGTLISDVYKRQDNGIPILVFSIGNPENIVKAVCGESVGTLVK